MKRRQRLLSQASVAYAKPPEVIRFVLATLGTLLTWAILAKACRAVWQQLDKVAWLRPVASGCGNLLVYLPFALMAVLFLMAFSRIVVLLKK